MSEAGAVGPSESASLHRLVAQVAASDQVAERQFVEQYRAGVRLLVRRHCRPNEPMVDDLTQDVLMSVLQRLRDGELRDPAALPGYVRQTVVFTVTSEYRKRARRGESGEPLADIVAGHDDPERATGRAQVASGVKRLLAEMAVPRDREVLRRFYLEEQDKDAVCAALAIDPSHFHRVLFRARQRLRELLEAAGLNRG